MVLRLPAGTPIPVVALPTPPAIIPEKLLDVPYFKQEEDNWCWAGLLRDDFSLIQRNKCSAMRDGGLLVR